MEELVSKNEANVCLSNYLSNLRKLKQNGTLDTSENFDQQTYKWRNTLEYLDLERYVGHHSEECRLETLALLVESKKSTLQFTSKELDIILLFLRCNLCEKMEYVSLIKKALKRLKDSLAVMQRQLAQKVKMEKHIASETPEKALALYQMSEKIENNIKDYTLFFINLRQVCVNNLYPDATYHRRRSSLQILLLAQEFLNKEFTDIEWKKEEVEIIFQCLLLDTYEPNKEMAYQLIKCTNPMLLYLDSEDQVEVMVRIALALGNSIRPIDSVTAAYMLKISILSPVIKNVLCRLLKTDDNVTETITLQLILLLYRKLQEALVLAKQNIGMAIVECSLYGYLFCIRSLLSDSDLRDAGKDKSWQSAIANVILLCFELNHTVSVIVNSASPEGYLPKALQTLILDSDASLSENEIVTSQMVLLCSWHTVKEVSHLFGLLATKASIQTSKSKDELLTKEQIEQMMKHLVSLLCETKHRGAFEQAYVGFHQLCTRLWQLEDATLNILPIQYLHNTLIGITGFMPGYLKLCATRRSAGVPFLIQAVLSSALKAGDHSKKHFFHSVMKILLKFAKFENTVNPWQEIKRIMYEQSIFSYYKNLMEPKTDDENECHEEVMSDVTEIKTHAMNILRALFRHSQFGDMVEKYVADGLIVAFKSYDGKTWAERNAATLLFSALIVRIFGVQRTKDHINLTTYNTMTGRLFFERYSTVLPFILDELRTFTSTYDTVVKSNVQAILLLLSRLYINNLRKTDNTWKKDELRNLVSDCAKSPVYQTRELAARALVPLLTESTVLSTLKNLFEHVKHLTKQSHGYLLQILIIVKKFPSVLSRDVLQQPPKRIDLLEILDMILTCNHSFNWLPMATVYIDILRELYEADRDIIYYSEVSEMLRMLEPYLIEKDLSKPGQPLPGEHMYQVSIIKFMLCVGKYTNLLRKINNGQSKAFEIYSRLLITPEAEVQSIAWNTVSEVLTREQESKQRQFLNNYAIHVAGNFVDLHERNPDVQDALFDFLYKCLTNAEKWFAADASDKNRDICTLVLRKMHSHHASYVYCQRINYLRLLGKCMAILVNEFMDDELEMEYKEDVYKKVCDNEWIGSLCGDFRSSVFDILYDLFDIFDVDIGQYQPVLDWWTVTLQLLVDDNVDVRHEACKLICRIKPSNELECIERILPVFFRKFKNTVVDNYPAIGISALFCWSVSLLGDADYEMVQTDIILGEVKSFERFFVLFQRRKRSELFTSPKAKEKVKVFNKCRNYDVFEPVRISKMCYDLTKSITQLKQYCIDSTLPLDVVKWINYRLDSNFAAKSYRDIVCSYMRSVPEIKKWLLCSIVDPTYKDKLLQVLACERYATL